MQLILVGGFLGAGKTTAIAGAVAWLKQKNIQSAIVTNDQGSRLIDTEWMRSKGFPTEEVTGGCFCCNFNDLDKAIQNLIATIQPGVIFAESVGSCTDLIATLLKPMKQAYPEMPISLTVVADATVLLAQWKGGQYVFRKNVHYIYDKQLEEADIIVLSKTDLLSPDLQKKIVNLATARYPGKMVLSQNNLAPSDIERWLGATRSIQMSDRLSLEIDYPAYGAGEAELAWLDASVVVEGRDAFQVAEKILIDLHQNVLNNKWPVGHLKGLLTDEEGQEKISFTTSNITQTAGLRTSSSRKVELMINARIQCEPLALRALLEEMIGLAESETVKVTLVGDDHFSPGFPRPTHRIA